MNIRSTLLATLLLALSAPMHAAQTVAPEPLTTEQKDVVTTRLNNIMAISGGSSVAALIAGLALKNDTLNGIGIAGLTSTACYALENDKNWVFMWIAAGIARMGLASKLHTTKAQDMILNDNDIKTAELSANVGFSIIEALDPEQARQLNKDTLINNSKRDIQLSKARKEIRNSSFYASWISYIVLRYMGRKIEQDVRATAV